MEEILKYQNSLPPLNIALIYNNLGLVQWNLGRYEMAKTNYQYSLKLISNIPSSKKLQSLLLNNYAILQDQRGELSSALEYYSQSEEIVNSQEKKDQSFYDQISMIYLNKAQTHFRLGEFSKALSYSLRSSRIKQEYSLPYLGSTYFVQAQSYNRLSYPERADSLFLKSIDQWSNEFSSSYLRLAGVYLEYGKFLTEQGKDSLGIAYFDKALQNYLTNYGKYHTYTASAYHLIAEYYLKTKSFEKAFESIQLALISVCPEFEPSDIFENPTSQESLLETRLLKIYETKIDALAQYAKKVNLKETDSNTYQKGAISLLQLAITTNEEAIKVLNRIQRSYLSQESRLFLAENQKSIFLSGIENALELNRLTGEKKYQDLAYYFASIGKSLELRYEMNRKEEIFLQNQIDSTSINLLVLKEDLDSYTNLIQREQLKANPDSTKISSWRSERFELYRSYEEKYRKAFDQEMDTLGFPSFTENYVADLRSKIGRDQTCVEYTLTDPDFAGLRKLYTFLINRKEISINESVLDSSLANHLKVIQKNLAEFNPIEYSGKEKEKLDSSLNYFFRTLIEPIEDEIYGNRIIVIPDNEIALIPFGALKRDSGNTFLINDYEISYMPNAQHISRNRHKRFRNKPELRIVAHNYANNSEDSIRDDGTDIQANLFQELGTAEQEAKDILGIMKGKWIKPDLLKDQIIDELKEADILHFAMHASSSSSQLSSASLALSSVSDSTYDHLLHDYEIEPLDLKTDLVVLNACSSGSGALYHGEGIFSLSRSFLLGGSKAVIQTQWPINDISGSEIITQFYRELSTGKNKAKALRRAQLHYLDESFPAFRHPYYWAAYQMVGDDSPIAPNRRVQLISVSLVVIANILALFLHRKKSRGKPDMIM